MHEERFGTHPLMKYLTAIQQAHYEEQAEAELCARLKCGGGFPEREGDENGEWEPVCLDWKIRLMAVGGACVGFCLVAFGVLYWILKHR